MKTQEHINAEVVAFLKELKAEKKLKRNADKLLSTQRYVLPVLESLADSNDDCDHAARAVRVAIFDATGE